MGIASEIAEEMVAELAGAQQGNNIDAIIDLIGVGRLEMTEHALAVFRQQAAPPDDTIQVKAV